VSRDEPLAAVEDVVALIGVRQYQETADFPAERSYAWTSCASVQNANPLFWDDAVAEELTGGPIMYEEDRRGEFHTVGDIAYRDEDGYLYICDRKKDMIISGGMNIYPAEIEAALEEHPDIYEVAVFGVPSEEWGEGVHAVVVAREGSSLSADAVMSFAREHLAGYKVPRTVSFMDELPRTGSGKILKRQLREPYWAGRASRV
jgi:acyl-CoA synthetase (AMP-forming)/AMP-acid ligase II